MTSPQEDLATAAPVRPRWQRFTIATLMFLVFCAAGTFVGFRYGLTVGIETQVERKLADQKAIKSTFIYQVANLVADSKTQQIDPAELDRLVFEIENALGVVEQKNRSGPCVIASGGTRTKADGTLLISASPANQSQVAAYLAGRRRSLAKHAKRDLDQ